MTTEKKDATAEMAKEALTDKPAAELKPHDNGPEISNPRAPAAVAAQHEAVDRAKAELNEANREGHEKNMDRLHNEAMEAQARTEHAHDPRANHVPTGKQNNYNTPRILPDGTKVW